MNSDFKTYLEKSNHSSNTISAYIYAVNQFFSLYESLSKNNLTSFKGTMMDKYKPKTVNLRIQGINNYLDFLGKTNLRIKPIKIQQKTFLENVISNADYEYLKNSLLKSNNIFWYLVVRFLGATGARISELLKIKAEHVFNGYVDIYSKGGKCRRIYIPKELQVKTIEYLSSVNKKSGFIFCNKNGTCITPRGVNMQLKKYAKLYGINPGVVYPHSFRHRFAKNFIEKYKDIALLADLMGHDSIETTRIYLRKTELEQREIVDEIITW